MAGTVDARSIGPGRPELAEQERTNSTAHTTPMQSRRPSTTPDEDIERHQEEKKTDDDDPLVLKGKESPYNWSNRQKWLITGLVGSVFFNTTMASSIATGAMEQYIDGFHVSKEVAVLSLSCYMIGFALGPLLWSPLSELYGRRPVFLISTPCFMLFNLGCGFAQDMPTLLVLRVFAGLFGACPQSAAGATISDVFAPIERPWPMLVYSFCAFGGPVCGPWAGGFLYVSGNWRWIYYLLAIFAGLNTILQAFLLPETYTPVLRKNKAKRLRAQGYSHEQAPIEMHMTWHDILTIYLVRPFSMLFSPRELPLIYAAAWTGWAYALLFIFFEAYPVIFSGIYGFNAGETGLCFIAFGIGICLSIPIVWYFNRMARKVALANGGHIQPEIRLRMVAFTAPLMVLGFFWFGWTSRKEIHWIVPILGTIPIGTAVLLSFNALAVYVAQCYHIYAASALGAMAFSRCLVAVFMPLFARQMFEGLGPGWAASILGFVSLVAIPVPFFFQRWGEDIRKHSKLAIST
ncbi:MFS general substrate transporter [Meira miltonrushii]|uniref:MFS general substrate transporter n=1 Tax=Meira miltonrushii TaxID=1280837 RepID=A0A316VJZ0_9BASI|nr:MFS general substrate transporter [Meira miltonrushii]PWN36341.1 MFS general substrate transporter [Meira miltonrushii]